MKKLFRIFFLLSSLLLFSACSILSDNGTEKDEPTVTPSTPTDTENVQTDDSGKTTDEDETPAVSSESTGVSVIFENHSAYAVSVYLSNPKYTANLVVFAEVGASSSATKKYTGSIENPVTFFFIYNLNNFGALPYSYTPPDTTYDHKTQRLSKDATTTILIDEIEDFKTDSAFLILQNKTTSSIYLLSDTIPITPYGASEKEISYGEKAFYEITSKSGSVFTPERAAKARVVINSSDYKDLPDITYEPGKVYIVTVTKSGVTCENTTFFPKSGFLCTLTFKNPKNLAQTETVLWVEENTVLKESDFPIATAPEGYEFLGWYIDDDTDKIDEGFIVTQSYTLTAKWKPIEYTISYELNGGTNAEENPTQYTVESDTITLAEPTRAGYVFNGWYRTKNFSGAAITSIASGSVGNKTVYAKWSRLSSISFTVDELSDISVTTTDNADGSITFTVSETCDNYSWSVDGEEKSTSRIFTVKPSDFISGVYELVLEAKQEDDYYSYFAQLEINK